MLLAGGDFRIALADSDGLILSAKDQHWYAPWTSATSLGARTSFPFRIDGATRVEPDEFAVEAGSSLARISTTQSKHFEVLDRDPSPYNPWEAEIVGTRYERLFYVRRHGGCGPLMSVHLHDREPPRVEDPKCVRGVVHAGAIWSVRRAPPEFVLRRYSDDGSTTDTDLPLRTLLQDLQPMSDGRDLYLLSWQLSDPTTLYRYRNHQLALAATWPGGEYAYAIHDGALGYYDGSDLVLTDLETGDELARRQRPRVHRIALTAERILWIEDTGLWMVSK